jgi:hypothetical protein
MFGKLNQEIVGSHTEAEWLDLLSVWNWRCFYCAEPVQRTSPDPQHEATKDHMVPISRGGVDFIGNIVPACLRCNQLKGNTTVEEFRKQRDWVINRKSTGITYCRELKENPQVTPSVEVTHPGPPLLPTLEIAAMWKRVLDAASSGMRIDGERSSSEYWRNRRAVLKVQADGIKRTRLESAGQLVLPMFGDGTARKLMDTEPQALAFNGIDLDRRKA